MFWAFTYALFAYRTNLRYGDAYELVSVGRLISTMVGAGLYWLVLSRLIDGTRERPGKALAVIAAILPASIVVLLARVLLDHFALGSPNGFAGDLRFVMVWGGYFGLWVSASFALRTVPTGTLPLRPAAQVKPRIAAQTQFRPRHVELLALEIAALPEVDRQDLIGRLTVPCSYETADELEKHPR